MSSTVKANPDIILHWAKHTKCVMCRHREDEGHILPVGKALKVLNMEFKLYGKNSPKFSTKWMFHYQDTHGLPYDLVMDWIWSSVYGLPMEIK